MDNALINTSHIFIIIANRDNIILNFFVCLLYSCMSLKFATGVASQQGTLTLPDTWFRPPFWDLLMLQLLRPNSSSLPCLFSTFHLEYPLVLSRFCLRTRAIFVGFYRILIYLILLFLHLVFQKRTYIVIPLHLERAYYKLPGLVHREHMLKLQRLYIIEFL